MTEAAWINGLKESGRKSYTKGDLKRQLYDTTTHPSLAVETEKMKAAATRLDAQKYRRNSHSRLGGGFDRTSLIPCETQAKADPICTDTYLALGMRAFQLKPAWLFGILVWLGLIAGSYTWLLRYSFASGKTSVAPRTIPTDLGLSPRLARPQLLLALHPRCPCSRATVSELAKILSRAPNTSDVTVLMYKPPDEPDGWLEGALLDACRRMHCRIRPDPGGRLAASLGSLTSGVVVLYDADGRLRYQGGITSSRGHEGDNAGERAIIEILQGHRDSHRSMPVFGCPIQQPN